MPVEFKDYYKSLGVTRDASAEDIKKAFRKLARQYHPDVAKVKKGAEEKFKEINEAYEVLGDPENRRKYDELGANWREEAEMRRSPGWQEGGSRGAGGQETLISTSMGPVSVISLNSSLVAAGGLTVLTLLCARGPGQSRKLAFLIVAPISRVTFWSRLKRRWPGRYAPFRCNAPTDKPAKQKRKL